MLLYLEYCKYFFDLECFIFFSGFRFSSGTSVIGHDITTVSVFPGQSVVLECAYEARLKNNSNSIIWSKSQPNPNTDPGKIIINAEIIRDPGRFDLEWSMPEHSGTHYYTLIIPGLFSSRSALYFAFRVKLFPCNFFSQ